MASSRRPDKRPLLPPNDEKDDFFVDTSKSKLSLKKNQKKKGKKSNAFMQLSDDLVDVNSNPDNTSKATEETPSTSTKDTPSNSADASAKDTPSEEAAAKDTPSDKAAAAKDTPSDDASTKDTPSTSADAAKDANSATPEEQPAENIDIDVPIVPDQLPPEDIGGPDDIPRLENLFEYVLMKEKCRESYRAYNRTWREFCTRQNITNSKLPTQRDCEAYFQWLACRRLSPAVLRSRYSHLTKACICLWNFGLDKWKRIIHGINAYCNGYLPKKAGTFEKEELQHFFSEVDLDCPYSLVRAVVCTIGFLGGNRMVELHRLNRSDVKFSEEVNGFLVTFQPAKCRKNGFKRSTLIPRDIGEDDVDYFGIIQKYLADTAKDVEINDQTPLFLKGQSKTQIPGQAHFENSRIGINTLREIPRWVAKLLDLPNWKQFTGHSLRRTSATEMADSGASEEQMKTMFGWSSGKMTKEYKDCSKKTMKNQAEFLTGGRKTPQPSTSTAPPTTSGVKRAAAASGSPGSEPMQCPDAADGASKPKAAALHPESTPPLESSQDGPPPAKKSPQEDPNALLKRHGITINFTFNGLN